MIVHLVFLIQFIWIEIIWNPIEFLIIFIWLLISHWVSYKTNFIKKQEYKNTTVAEVFSSPYPRIIAMHIAIFWGDFFAVFFATGNMTPAIGIVIIKTVIDIFFHIKEHKISPLKEEKNNQTDWIQITSSHNQQKINWKIIIQSIFVIWIIIAINTNMFNIKNYIQYTEENIMQNFFIFQQGNLWNNYLEIEPNNINNSHIPQAWSQNITETLPQNITQEIKNTVSNADSRYSWCDTNDITVGRYTISSCDFGTNKAGINEESYGTPLSFDQAQIACTTGYHLPSIDEWNKLFIDYFNIEAYDWKLWKTREDLSTTIEVFQKELQLPMARIFGEWVSGTYWSATKHGEGWAKCISFNSKEIITGWECNTKYWDEFSIRCFKDENINISQHNNLW